MDEKDLTSLLRAAATHRQPPTAFCPEDQAIAVYVDGALDPAEREQLERHLADCDACISRVGRLSRLLSEADPTEPVPQPVLARARGLGQKASRRWPRHAPYWATAATVLIASLAVVNWPEYRAGDVPQTLPEHRTTRNSLAGIAPPQLLFPSAGVTLDPTQLVLRWTEVPASLYYEVHVVTAAGDLVGERRTTETEWHAADELDLEPGAEYFVRVAAYLSDDQTLSSDHIAFTVAEP